MSIDLQFYTAVTSPGCRQNLKMFIALNCFWMKMLVVMLVITKHHRHLLDGDGTTTYTLGGGTTSEWWCQRQWWWSPSSSCWWSPPSWSPCASGGDGGLVPRDLSGSWDSPGQTRRAEEGADGPQVGKKGQKGKKRTKKGNKEKECIKKQLQKTGLAASSIGFSNSLKAIDFGIFWKSYWGRWKHLWFVKCSETLNDYGGGRQRKRFCIYLREDCLLIEQKEEQTKHQKAARNCTKR